MKRHRVAICVDGLGDSWLGGVNYFRNLIKAFDAAKPENLELFVLTDNASFLSGDVLSEHVHVIELPMMRWRSLARNFRKAVQHVAGRDLLMLRKLKSLGIELVAFSFVAGADRIGIRCVPWVPDFQSERHPEFYSPDMVEAERKRTRMYLADAGRLIVSSESARADAQKYFGAGPERVDVVSFAPRVDDADVCSARARDEVLATHAIDRPYLFLPNQYWRHKNHFVVARALAALKRDGATAAELPLIISTGNTEDHRNPEHFPEFQAFLRDNGLDANYRILGIIPRGDMLALLAHCAGLINPSLFEGWSSTVEEAKALGKSLIVSDIPVHREQVRHEPSAVIFDPHDPEALARLLREAAPRTASFDAYGCRPRPQLHEAFTKNYIAMLNRLVTRPTP